MAPRLKSRRTGIVCGGVVLLAVGLALFAARGASAITPAECDARANDTQSKLLECITTDDLMAHMQAFQDIADANPSPADGHPSRNSGEPGYLASALYVKKVMEDAGYNARIQTYKFDYYAFTGVPAFSEDSPTAHDYILGTEWGPGQTTGSTTGSLAAAGGIVLPPTPLSSSTSGCTMADFPASISGHVALIQRGFCNFGVKVLNAKAAGATGVVIFNEGNPGRTGLTIGSMLDANDNPFIPDIPVAFTTFDVGLNLYNQIQTGPAPVVSLSVPATVTPNADDYNVIAESKGGDKNHVLVVDAHLDAIYGAGMLDNASGSATILDIAQQMKNVTPRNKLRFIWFGGEELGLLGSSYYINNATKTELSHIGYDLDADVTATPNYSIGVLDPAAPNFFSRTVTESFPNRVYKASTIARNQAIKYFDSIGKNHILFSPLGTDAFSFNAVGIPASGLLTGQDCCKTQQEVNLFGGSLGNYEGNIPSFDGGCVDNPFLWCDNLDNNDPEVLTFMSKAFATMVLQMAFDTKIMSASNNVVINKKLPLATEGGRHPAK
jgi:hypothetical protein